MPTVPRSGNVVPIRPQVEEPSPTMFAMAAFMMHAEGRLIDAPKPVTKGTDDNRNQ